MAGEGQGQGRTWRGRNADERREIRRRQLIDAGIERFGTDGYAATSVKAICDEAGLTERYFYENFRDREALLKAVYEILIRDATSAVLEKMNEVDGDADAMLKAGLATFARHVAANPKRARIQQLEVVGVSDRIEEVRRGAIHAFADLIADTLRRFGSPDHRDGVDLDVMAIGLVGLVNEQLIDFVRGELDVDIERLIENQASAFTVLSGVILPAERPGRK